MNSRKITDMHNFCNEENLLLAASNGYVSTYIYDGEGQRTVKMSTPYEAVYTNSADATVPSDTLRYTLYVGPYYTVSSKSGSEDEDPLYVKHFFIGDKRIASKIGNPPGNDPRGITGVAGKTLHIKEGQSVILRNGSTDGFKPTIEVQEKKNGKSKSVYKIRYGK